MGVRNTATACAAAAEKCWERAYSEDLLFQMHENHLEPEPLCLYVFAEGSGNWGLLCSHLEPMGDFRPGFFSNSHVSLVTDRETSSVREASAVCEVCQVLSLGAHQKGQWWACLPGGQTASGTWLALQKWALCPALLVGAQIRPMPFASSANPVWQVLPGQLSASWVRPMKGLGGRKENAKAFLPLCLEGSPAAAASPLWSLCELSFLPGSPEHRIPIFFSSPT